MLKGSCEQGVPFFWAIEVDYIHRREAGSIISMQIMVTNPSIYFLNINV